MSPFQSSAQRWKTTATAAVILVLARIKLSEKPGQILPPINAFYEIAKFSSHRNVQTIVLSRRMQKSAFSISKFGFIFSQILCFCGFKGFCSSFTCVCVSITGVTSPIFSFSLVWWALSNICKTSLGAHRAPTSMWRHLISSFAPFWRQKGKERSGSVPHAKLTYTSFATSMSMKQ